MLSLVLAGAAFAATFFYFIILPVILYFVDRKGLRKYPAINPIAGFSDVGFMWEATQGFRSKKLYELHKKNPVIRIGPNSVSYSDLSAIKDIYGHNTKCDKDIFYEKLAGSHYHLADVIDRPEHARKRRVLSAAYAIRHLENWEFKVADKTERFIRACDKACTAPLDAGKFPRPNKEDLTFDYRSWTNFFTLDAIADIGLSERLGFLDQGHDGCEAEQPDGTRFQVQSYRACLHATAHAQSQLVWSYDWYKFLEKYSRYVSPKFARLWKLNEGWNGIVRRRVTKRLERYQAGEELDDFFQCLMEDKSGNPHNLDFGELEAEMSIMLNAGSDTTAIAMNNVMFWLLKNPKCLKQLREEVDEALDDDDVVAPYAKVKHLPYLKACIDEALRITPPTTFGLPRRTPKEGLYIAGDFVPGDTSVSVSAYVAHRDEDVFPEPEKYKPERWFGEEGKKLQSYFITFSAGARGCIGRNISYLEQSVLLASVVHRYEFALPYPEFDQERWENMNLSPGPMPLKVWRRDLGPSELMSEKAGL